MKKILLLTLISALLVSCGKNESSETLKLTKSIDSLLSIKEFFLAKELFTTNDDFDMVDQLRWEAYIANAFNDKAASNMAIDKILTSHKDKISDSITYRLLELKSSNHVKLFEYEEAFDISNQLISGYSGFMSKEDLQDTKNNAIIWEGLKNVAPQIVSINETTQIPIVRNMVGLSTIEVKADSATQYFIFDTGANFSTIIESEAKRFGMEIIEAPFEVGTITGGKVMSKLGVARNLMIENIDLSNVVFLVLPDEALFIPQIDLQLNGIVGFPVMEAMGELQFYGGDKIIIPEERTQYAYQNMAIDFLNPIVQIRENGKSMSFTFDSGANETILYEAYFKANADAITNSYSPDTISFAGAAGTVETIAYSIPFQPTIGDKSVFLDSISVLQTNVISDSPFYGNLGQDFISKFGVMTINFREMFIRFSD